MNSSRVSWARSANSKGRALICMTTLGHRRFVDDAVQVVGLPHGSCLLLRYRKRYVAPELWELAKEDDIEQWHALVVLASDAGGEASFEPLRVGRICRRSIEGEILTLEIALAGFAADGTYVWPGVASSAKSLPIGEDGKLDRTGHYAQMLRSFPVNVIVDEGISAWERAATSFFKMDEARNVPFLYFMQGRSLAFERYRQSGRLVAESGSKLEWNVHTLSAPQPTTIVSPLGEVLVEVSCQSARMVTSRRVRVDSQRDVKRMELSCDAVFRAVSGHLSVKVVVFQADPAVLTCASDRNPLSLSRYDIPLRVGRVLPNIASLAAAVAAAVALVDKTQWGDLSNFVAVGAGMLVFLSLKLGFSSSAS